MKSRDKMIFVINRLLGCFFEMLYHQLAAAYDLVAWLVSFGRWYRWVEKVIPLISGRDVLEIGIGTGYLNPGSWRVNFARWVWMKVNKCAGYPIGGYARLEQRLARLSGGT